ncbi:MAG: hypothetical protein ACOH5I_12250 [Oligoflexus sp.]
MVEVDHGDNIEIEESSGEESSSSKSAKKSKRQGAEAKTQLKKLRLTIEETEDGRLHTFMNALRDRGVKNPDLGVLVSEALATVNEDWWTNKIEELTPLEWKVQAALENPDLREKLVTLLEGKKG